MPDVPIEFLRGVAGVACIFFAHMTGRCYAAVRSGRQRPNRMYLWIFRTLLCAGLLAIRHEIDGMAVAVWIFAAAAFGAGLYAMSHRKPPEDLTHQIFPE